jgi:hypothetical protein
MSPLSFNEDAVAVRSIAVTETVSPGEERVLVCGSLILATTVKIKFGIRTASALEI